MSDTTPNGEGYQAETASRSMRMLLIAEAVAKAEKAITPSELKKSTGLPKQTLHRLIASLEKSNFIQRDLDGRSYIPASRLHSMATSIFASAGQSAARNAVISTLVENIGETCNLTIPDKQSMVYHDRVESNWPLRIQLPAGSRVPFHCTASGKMYLSSLSNSRLERVLKWSKLTRHAKGTITDPDTLLREIGRIREQGFAEDNEEFIEGMIAIAVPILDTHNRLSSTLSFHAPKLRMSLKEGRKHLGELQQAAEELSRIIAGGD